MNVALRWIITTAVGAVTFGLTWWICQVQAGLDKPSAISIATVATTIICLPFAWWAGRETRNLHSNLAHESLTSERSRILNRVQRYEFRNAEFQRPLDDSFDLELAEDSNALSQIPDEGAPPGSPQKYSAAQIYQIFNDSDGALLILGSAGSGKSTLLRMLLKLLLEIAHDNIDSPMPFLLDLTSWSDQSDLSEWLIQELRVRYELPEEVANSVVASRNVALLLDSLDALPTRRRNLCAEAISRFRYTHGLTSLAVACRKLDYADLATRPSLRITVSLQPLSRQQVMARIQQTEGIGTALEKEIISNSKLLDLLSLPLALALTLRSVAVEASDSAVHLENDHSVVRGYLELMLAQVSVASKLEKDVASGYLRWIADYLHSSQSYFRIDQLQPSAVSNAALRRVVYSGVRVPAIVLTWLAFGALATLSTGTVRAILAGGLVAVTVAFIGGEDKISLQDPYGFALFKRDSGVNVLVQIGRTVALALAVGCLFAFLSAIFGWLLLFIFTGI
jgi:energy-coupling factor transporter ATP-binding protein EcfA2